MRCLYTFSLVLVSCGLLSAQVVPGTHIQMTGAMGSDEYDFRVEQYADATDHTCNFFSWNNGSVDGAYCLDEGADWFVVQQGDEVSRQTIGEPDLGFGFSFPNSQYSQFFDSQLSLGVGDEFLLGVITPLEFDDSMFVPDAFGWARMRVIGSNLAQELELIDNVMVYGELGILAGTEQIVPEPNCLSAYLLGLAILFSGCDRRCGLLVQ